MRVFVCAREDKDAGRQQKFIPRRLRLCRATEISNFGFRNGLDVYCAPMPKAAHREEIEIKLRVEDIGALRARLKRLRARKLSPRTYESNTLYDTPRHDLRCRGQLVRLRIEQPASSFGKRRPDENASAVLTYKGPPPSSRSARNVGGNSKFLRHFKIKEEAEVSFSGTYEMARILRALGLFPVFRYEKFRTTYTLPGIRELKVELDETPMGTYLELEGPPLAIDRGAHLLGYGRDDYMTDTYGSLYLADCARRGRKPEDMLFPPTKKSC
jgi:adenylate cyclase class 2